METGSYSRTCDLETKIHDATFYARITDEFHISS